MDTNYSRRFPKRGETLTASIFKLPDGRHAAEITTTMGDTGESVLWSMIFKTDSIMEITGRTVRQFDYFVAVREGQRPGPRPKDQDE